MINNKINSNWIKEGAEAHGQFTALSTKAKTYSYSALHQRIIQTAAYFEIAGIEQNKNTAILLESSIEFIISLFAIWNCGSTVVPLNPHSSADELMENLKFTNCERIITNRRLSDKFEGIDRQNLFFIDEIKGDVNCEPKDIPIYQHDSPAIIMFTSGSSGVKKAAVLTFSNLYASSKNIDGVFNFAPGEKWLASLPFYHIGGMQVIIRSVLSGGELIVLDEINTQNILDCISQTNMQYISVVNSILQQMIERKIIPADNTKAVFAGGGPINNELLSKANDLSLPVYKVYGSTETASMVTLLSPKDIDKKIDSAGKPIGDVEIKILDDERNEATQNVTGEIAVKGRSVILSYYNNAVLSEEKFYNGYFLTGDNGYIDEDGYLFVLGRKDNFIITGGEKVNPDEVKQALMELNCFADVHVLGVDDKKWGQKVCAVYILKNDVKITGTEIKDKLTSKLASYKIPKEMIQLKEFPKTGLGKIDTLKLKALLS